VSVFVSYRRRDTAGYAGRLCEHLCGVLGAENVFFDVQDIAPGQDFVESIDKTMSACQAVVVVIGPEWAADLKKRADGEDFVRQEVSAALRRKAPVFPVLVGGATMPTAAELPEGLAPLTRRQALEIRDARFDDDVKVLVNALQKVRGVAAAPARPPHRRWRVILIAAVLLAAIAGAIVFWQKNSRPDISGIWIADLQKPRQRPFRVRLDLAESDGTLTGTVLYPTGEGAVQDGKVTKDRLTFFTRHVPRFASEEVTIRWTGIVEDQLIRFTVADDNGAARGVAHRKKAASD
jgi:hypothetical protein